MQKNYNNKQKNNILRTQEFVNKFTSQRRGVHNDLICQNMISKQVH